MIVVIIVCASCAAGYWFAEAFLPAIAIAVIGAAILLAATWVNGVTGLDHVMTVPFEFFMGTELENATASCSQAENGGSLSDVFLALLALVAIIVGALFALVAIVGIPVGVFASIAGAIWGLLTARAELLATGLGWLALAFGSLIVSGLFFRLDLALEYAAC